MGDLIADVVEFHGSLPVLAALLEDQGQPVLEAQARESAVLRIVERPGAAMPAIILRLPLADGRPARLLDVGLQLTPREHEVRLVVDPLFFIDGIERVVLARPVLRVAQASEMEIHLLVHGRDGVKVAH